MNTINRQKFLAELARLLSFMYEEDRRYALDMYGRMFDIAAEDEQWLIQNLMSPTRQAVIIARAYDAKERRLSVSARWKEEDGYEDTEGETPSFVLAINQIFDDLFSAEDEDLVDVSEEVDPEDEGQFSLFDPDAADEKKSKQRRMPGAAILLNRTQEFTSVTVTAEEIARAGEEYGEDDENFLSPEMEWAEEEMSCDPDPRINVIEREDYFGDEEDTDDTEGELVRSSTAETAEALKDNPKKNPKEGQPSDSRENAEQEPAAGQKDPQEKLPEKAEEPKQIDLREAPASSLAPGIRTAEDNQGKNKTAENTGDEIRVPQEASDRTEHTGSKDGARKPRRSIEELLGFRRETHSEGGAVNAEEEHPVTDDLKAGHVLSLQKKTHEVQESAGLNPVQKEKQTAPATRQPGGALPEEDRPVIQKPERTKMPEVPAHSPRVWNVPLLVVFLIVAIPVTLALLILLSLLAAVCLGLSVGMGAVGSVLVMSAFSGFAVLADIMLLLGAAVAALGLGLLFLWITFWLIGDGMVSLVQSVRELAEAWCRKEASAA